MAAHEPVSLTGADCGAPQTHLPSVSRALTRLRAGVLMVALLAIAALIVQIGVWGLATFTSIRWADQSPSPAITQGEPRIVVQDRAQEGQRPSPFEAHGIDTIAAGQSPVDVNRVPGAGDGVLRMAASGALGIGSMAIVALVPLIALGALLAINSSTEGVEQAVSAFMWVIVVCLLTTPVSQALGLPWDIASLWRYERLTGDLADRPDPALVDWARYVLLPMASIIGLALVTLRFSAGVESGLLRRESFLLDPELEKEAANRKPGSHFGGRAAAALERLDQVVRETPAPAVAVPVSANSTPVTTPAAGAPMPRSTPLATGALPVVSAPPPEPPPRRPI